MLTGFLVSCVLVSLIFPSGLCSSLLCGRTEKLELGSNSGAGAALALALVRPPTAPRTPCQLSLTAPDAAAFAVRLIDVKIPNDSVVCHYCWIIIEQTSNPTSSNAPTESIVHRNLCIGCGHSLHRVRSHALNNSSEREDAIRRVIEQQIAPLQESLAEWERGRSVTGVADLQVPPQAGVLNRKWSARTAAHAQDTATDQSAPVNNSTDACKLLIYIGDAKTPTWRLNLCGGNAAAVAARAGTRLLPSKLRIVWNPPTSPYQHTEKLRLVITAVNSGSVCNNDSQFICGVTSLCISSYLVCDGVRHCPGGEDEDPSACSHRHDPPLLELLRRFAARNQELLGLDQPDGMTKPSVIMKINDSEKSSNAFMEFAAALKPYGPWSYLVVGMLVCATILMFCLAWECCCKRSKPSDMPVSIPPSCIDLSPTVTVTAASQQLFTQPLPPSPPEYEPPPSYSSLFPRAFKSSPTPVPHCSHQEPPD